eukprot:2608264-Amphidinium_carterae.2
MDQSSDIEVALLKHAEMLQLRQRYVTKMGDYPGSIWAMSRRWTLGYGAHMEHARRGGSASLPMSLLQGLGRSWRFQGLTA